MKRSKPTKKHQPIIQVGILMAIGLIGLFVILLALQNNTENRSKAYSNSGECTIGDTKCWKHEPSGDIWTLLCTQVPNQPNAWIAEDKCPGACVQENPAYAHCSTVILCSTSGQTCRMNKCCSGLFCWYGVCTRRPFTNL